MATLLYTEAFAAYGGKLASPQWAYSAVASDGAIVVSCWAHKLKLIAGKLISVDRLSRWKLNPPGKNLLIEHLNLAIPEKRPVRLIIVTTTESDVVDRGEDSSAIPKTFHIRHDVVGKVAHFDGDNFEFEFRRSDA